MHGPQLPPDPLEEVAEIVAHLQVIDAHLEPLARRLHTILGDWFACPDGDTEAEAAYLDAWDASIFGEAERAIATIAVRGNAVIGDSPVESWLAEHGATGFGIDE